MHITTTPLFRLPGSVHRTAGLALAAAAAALSLTACQGTGGDGKAAAGPAPSGAAKQNAKPRRLLWMGDSIAEAEAPALEAAMKAGRAEFRSMASAGGGGVTGPIAQPTWKALAKELRTFRPDVVAYQITTYDWGAPAEQRAGYERLARTVKAANAELLILPSPPFKVDDFYKPHANEIRTAPKAAVQVARRHPETVHFLDSSALWGTDRAAAKAQRSKDGIHSCQQGSASFAKWFGDRQHELFSFAPAPPERWATGPWTGAKVYSRLGCK